MPESYSVEAVLTAKDQNFSGTFKNANNSVSSFGKLASKGLATVAKVGVAAITGAAGGIAAFGVKSVQAGMDFDSSMSQVAATMGTTVDQIGDLRDFAQEMGRTTAFSATQSADALNYMALAGYDAKTSMEMLPNVLNLAAAGGIELAQASDMVTDAQSAFGLTTAQTTAMVDQMAKTSSKTNTSVQQLGEGFLKIGATARNLKGGTQELATMLGVLADNGIKGAEGGTHFRNILLSLQNPTEAGAKALKDLGVQVYDSSGKMRSTIDIVKDMQNGMKGMSDEAKQAMLSGMFNKTDLAAVNALLNTSSDRFDELSASIGDCAGAAQEMADTQLDNLEGDVTLFKSALEGAEIALSDGLNPALRALTQAGTKGLEYLTKAFEKLNTYVEAGVKSFKSVKGVGTAVGEAFKAVAEALFGVQEGGFGSTESINSFADACKVAAEKVKQFAEWVKEHANGIAKLIKLVPKLTVAFAGLAVLSKVAPALKVVGGAFAKIASSVGGAIASKITKVGTATATAGKTSAASAAQLLKSAQAFALMGAAVLEIAAAFALLAFTAIQLASAGGAAIAVFFGMVVAVGALAAVMMVLAKSMSTISPAKLSGIATAFLAMGAAVLLVAAGFALLAFSAIQLSNAGAAAIVTFFGMVVAIGLLAALFAYLGPMLTAGAVGMLALGAAVLLVGAGVAIACAGIALLATQLPLVSTYGLSAAVAFLAMGAALIVFGAGALVAGAGLVVLAAGLLVFSVAVVAAAVGVAALALAVGALAIGFAACAVGVTALGVGLALVGASAGLAAATVALFAAALVAVTAAGLAATAGLVAFEAALVLVTATVALAAAAVLLSVASFAAFAGGAALAAAALVAVVAQLKIMQSSLKSIASQAKTANNAITSMKSGLSIVQAGLDAVSNKVKSVTNNLISSFKNAGNNVKSVAQQMTSALNSFATSASSTGQNAGNGFANGLRNGMNQAVNAAGSAVNAIVNAMRSGYNGAYNSGAYIGQGLANGMRSMLGTVRSIASQLVNEANKAIAAKAKIGSPSKVTTYYGEMVGQGFINGMNNKAPGAANAAAGLFDPSVSVPNYAYSGGLNNDYNYNTRSTIVVPLSIDGKEFARATAPYNIAENNKAQARANRAKGWR